MDGPIESIKRDEVLTLGEFRRRTGFARASMTGLYSSGLPVKRVGKRVFIRGGDWYAFLDRLPDNRQFPCHAIPERKAV